MSSKGKLPEAIQIVLEKGLLKRLPLTFLPFVNQHLREWDYLFPFEKQSVERLVVYLGELSPGQFAGLFRPLHELELKMGVRHWQFDTREETIENASLLARSPYYLQWRREVQDVFDHVDQNAPTVQRHVSELGNRLVLLILPRRLPLDSSKAWKHWEGQGKPVRVDLGSPDAGRNWGEILFAGGSEAERRPHLGLLEVLAQRTTRSPHEAWILDAGAVFVESLMKQAPAGEGTAAANFLSFDRLKPFRENFSQQMNSMRKDLADADAVYARLRQVDVTPWCPPEVAAQPIVREFVRSVFLNGNGAVIFGNSFVEWGASEAFRRARPSVLVAYFGTRLKPKPFSGLAVFENQELANPVAPVEDLPGSAIDAQMLALYVWLAARRFPEYHRQTACVCIAESMGEAYVVAPPEFPLGKEPEPAAFERIRTALRAWLA